VTIAGDAARIDAPAGLRYQVLVDGRAVDVESRGRDEIPLTQP
jgi:hypothetical protein